MTDPQLAIQRAAALGRFAARRNLPVTSCPWGTGDTTGDRTQTFAWMDAYLHHKPPQRGAVDYTDDSSGDGLEAAAAA